MKTAAASASQSWWQCWPAASKSIRAIWPAISIYFRLEILQHAYPARPTSFALRSATLEMMYMELEHQTAVMAFLDDFRLLIAYIFFILTPLALLMRKPIAPSPASAVH